MDDILYTYIQIFEGCKINFSALVLVLIIKILSLTTIKDLAYVSTHENKSLSHKLGFVKFTYLVHTYTVEIYLDPDLSDQLPILQDFTSHQSNFLYFRFQNFKISIKILGRP